MSDNNIKIPLCLCVPVVSSEHYPSKLPRKKCVFGSAHFQGVFELALSLKNCSRTTQEKLRETAAHINYFGKRGSFFQYIKSRTISELPLGFTVKATDLKGNIRGYEIVQPLDDLGELNSKDLFDRINTFSDKKIERGKHRVFVLTYIPYKMEKSSTNYTAYVNSYRCEKCPSSTPT